MTSLVRDIQRWYRCTQEAAEHIATSAAEQAGRTGIPLANDLRSIVEAADMPFYIRRSSSALEMTLADVKRIQATTRKLLNVLDGEGGDSA